MAGRLDEATGMIHDRGWDRPMAMDRELRQTVALEKRPVSLDTALREIDKQRAEAERSPLARLIPGLNRLP